MPRSFSEVVPLPVSESTQSQCEVLISGAGPVGLYLGCALRELGVDVAIVDPHLTTGYDSKAAVAMPRTLEVCELIGASEALMEKGRVVTGLKLGLDKSWYGAVQGVATCDASRYGALAIGQNTVEAVLQNRYRQLGGRMYRAARVVAAHEGTEAISIDVERSVYVRPPKRTPDIPPELAEVKKTTLQAKYLVGCDGKQSKVRQIADFTYHGKEYSQVFLLCDVMLDAEDVKAKGLDSSTGCISLKDNKLLVFIHMDGNHWRLVIAADKLTEEHARMDFVMECLQEMMPEPGPPPLRKAILPTIFRISCRIVNTYHKGRICLAGDAAHCHSPAGGQGMNTGIQDAANLAWRLAAAIRRPEGSHALLDGYTAERKPIAEWVLNNSDKLFSFMTSGSRVTTAARTGCFRFLLPLVGPARMPPAAIVDKMFGVTHNYRQCGTCVTTGTAVLQQSSLLSAGDRLTDLACRTAETGATSLLQLLAGYSLTFRVLFVGAALPSEQELHALLSKLHTLGGWQVEIWIWSPVQDTGLPDYIQDVRVRSLQGGLALSNALKLKDSEQAQLVIRPDGYIAAVNRGSLDVEELVHALGHCGLAPHNGMRRPTPAQRLGSFLQNCCKL